MLKRNFKNLQYCYYLIYFMSFIESKLLQKVIYNNLWYEEIKKDNILFIVANSDLHLSKHENYQVKYIIIIIIL